MHPISALATLSRRPTSEASTRGRARRLGRALGGVTASAFLVLFPKCLGCVTAYLAFGTSVGLAGREICGGASTENHVVGFAHRLVNANSVTLLTIPLALSIIVAIRFERSRRRAATILQQEPRETTLASCCR